MKDKRKKESIDNSQINNDKKIILNDEQKKKIRRIRKASRTLDYFILILSLLAMFIGIYAFWDTHKVMEIADSDYYEVYKPNSEDNLTFNDLKKINPDLIAWIDIYGTNIDYPVVQGKDNDEYLNKTVLGKFSTAGSIFLDSSNSKDFSDYQNIIYGHFMADRKMFGDLELFDDKKFFESHKYGKLDRLGKKTKGIEFFALIKTVGDDQKILNTAKTIKENPELIDYIYKNSKYSRKINLSEKENIVILDTCDFSVTNGRSILVGRLTDKLEKNIYKVKEKKENKFAKLISKFYKLNLLIILIIIWIILVLIYLIYQSISRKKREESNKNVQ